MKKELELYIHIPFCVRKCYYCDFLSAPSDEETREKYLKALLTELKGRAELSASYEIVSVFIGGGTPTVLFGEQIASLMKTVRENYSLRDNAEITIEINPGTVDAKKLALIREAGINRLSIGLQSADDAELRAIGRIHNWQQFEDTYEAAVKCGFTNINIDIMSTLPGQTCESYRRTLEKVTGLKPAPVHISAYSLILEEGTVLNELVETGQAAVPDEDLDRELYALTESFLAEKGYKRYEISNYAKENFLCRHNLGYWTGVEYLGFGIGAASLFGGKRFKNGSDLSDYTEAPLACIVEEQTLTEQERIEEFMFLGLRMTDGVSLNEFEKRFARALMTVYGDVVAKNVQDGLLAFSADGKSLFLTERGMDLSNYVSAQFLLT